MLARLVLGVVRYGDEDTVTELKGAYRGDLLPGRQAGIDDDLVAEHGAAFNLAGMDPVAAILVRCDDEHLIPSRPLAQRADRNGDGIPGETDRNSDAHRRSWRR